MTSPKEEEQAKKASDTLQEILAAFLSRTAPPSYANAANDGVSEVQDDRLVATADDARITTIKAMCAAAILGGFLLLLHLRGVTFNTTTIAEIIVSAVIGIAARILVSLSSINAFATGQPVLDTEEVSRVEPNKYGLVDVRQRGLSRGRPLRAPAPPAVGPDEQE